MTSSIYAKGDRVTYIRSYDDKGTVVVTDLIVHSCGAKQMVLVNEAGEKFMGTNFLPAIQQYGFNDCGGLVLPRLDRDEAERTATALAEIVVACERRDIPAKVEHYAKLGYADQPYRDGMQRKLDALHEPRIVWE